jgi:hypothetical protein
MRAPIGVVTKKAKNALFRGRFQAENGIFALFSLKIQT